MSALFVGKAFELIKWMYEAEVKVHRESNLNPLNPAGSKDINPRKVGRKEEMTTSLVTQKKEMVLA